MGNMWRQWFKWFVLGAMVMLAAIIAFPRVPRQGWESSILGGYIVWTGLLSVVLFLSTAFGFGFWWPAKHMGDVDENPPLVNLRLRLGGFAAGTLVALLVLSLTVKLWRG